MPVIPGGDVVGDAQSRDHVKTPRCAEIAQRCEFLALLAWRLFRRSQACHGCTIRNAVARQCNVSSAITRADGVRPR